MSNEGTTVTISTEEYEQLKEDARVLQALRNGGVDNWDGFDFAMEALQEEV
jgi:hypothetical protein